jgi:hypothetical protein
MTTNTKAGGRKRRDSATDVIECYRDRTLFDPLVLDWLRRVRAEVGEAIQANLICCQECPWPEADIYQQVAYRREERPELFRRAITLQNQSDFYCESGPCWGTTSVQSWDCLVGRGAAVRQAIHRGYQVVTAHAATGQADTVYGLVLMVPRD